MENCEPLRNLRTLVIHKVNNNNAVSMTNFLAKRTHIQKLSIGMSTSADLDDHIVPLLAGGDFTDLTSLSLHWDGPGIAEETRPNIARISDESLAAIGSISSLEQLCLTAGEWIGYRCQWLVDHEALRSHFSGLEWLKKLALCRDTYSTSGFGEPEEYYEFKILDEGDRELARERPDLDREVDYFEAAKRRQDEARRQREYERELERWNGADVEAPVEPDDVQDGNIASPDSDRDAEAEEFETGDTDVEDLQHSEPENDDLADSELDFSAPGSESEAEDVDHESEQSPNGDSNPSIGSAHSDHSDDDSDDDDPYEFLPLEEIWELAHRNYMLNQAEIYAATLPNLEWIHLGQGPMKVKSPGDHSFENAVPLSEERDSCRTFLSHTFGLGENDD